MLRFPPAPDGVGCEWAESPSYSTLIEVKSECQGHCPILSININSYVVEGPVKLSTYP